MRKLMNVLYSVNVFFFSLTLFLFVFVLWGFAAEFVLGIIQVASSLLLIIYWKEYSQKNKEKITLYWAVTGIYLSMWFFEWEVTNMLFYVVCVGIIPMSIALYFLSILRVIRKEDKQNTTPNMQTV